MTTLRFVCLIAVTCSFVISGSASGTTIHEENFTGPAYTSAVPHANNLAGQNPTVTGFTGAWAQTTGGAALTVTTTGLTYLDYVGNDVTPLSGDARGIHLGAGNSRVFYRELTDVISGSVLDGTSTYQAFLVRYNVLGNATNKTQAFAGLLDNANNTGILVGNYSGTNGVNGSFTEWGVYLSGMEGVSGGSITVGDTNLVVIRTDWASSGDETIRIYINPVLSNVEPVTPTFTFTENLPNTLSRLALWGFNWSSNQAGATADYDGFMLATEWSDLYDAPPPVVPEPATFVLMASMLFGLATCAFRRSKKV